MIGTGQEQHGLSAQTSAPSPHTLLYSSERTRIYRTAAEGAERLIYKEPRGTEAAERLRHERDMLARLEGVAGVPQLAQGDHPPHMLALRDHGGVSLAHLLRLGRMDTGAALALALALSRIVAALHARGVIHHDINPNNILLAEPQRSPMLIDLHLATAGKEPGTALRRQEIVGTLAYVSPEQVSLSGRAVDHRADLYALGATLYELLVGHPPFQQKDIAQLVRDQLNRTPTPPAALTVGLPPMLSALVMRLLEKEPDQRYQSADGLAHDLARIQAQAQAQQNPGGPADFTLGLNDFPPRLSAPAQLIGRSSERQQLVAAFERAMQGSGCGVLLSGAAGVGKKRLLAQLQALVAARGGYFIAGKFDQQRQDRQSDGLYLAFRALGRQLLAEPEEALLALRAQLHQVLGMNTALMASGSPEFAIILGMTPEPWPTSAVDGTDRLLTAISTLLRTVVTPQRPLVLSISDSQWIHPFPLAIIDTLLCGAPLPGLLLAVSWHGPLAADHPLAARLPHWIEHGALRMELGNLSLHELGTLLELVLRLPTGRAGMLAAALAEHIGGNPDHTLEMIHALRQSGVLRLTEHGWGWDPATLKRYVGSNGPASLLLARIKRLPPGSAQLLQTMACLSGDIRFDQLEAATGLAGGALNTLLAPALDDGLLACDADGAGAPLLRFRHDRVQQAVYGALPPVQRDRLHLSIARRLSTLPDSAPLAGAQYLAALALIDPSERGPVITLLRDAARLTRQSNDLASERLLHAALELLGEPAAADHAGQRLQLALRCEHHATLVRQGRGEQADALYAVIDRSIAEPLELMPATCLQIATLTLRRQLREAVALSMRMMDRLGYTLPQFENAAAIDHELDALEGWVDRIKGKAPLDHAGAKDARIIAIAMVIERTVRPAFFIDAQLLVRLVLGAWRLWQEHGLCAPMLDPAGFVGIVAIHHRGDYQLGYKMSRFLLGLGQARAYTLETLRQQAAFSVSHAHWREPLDACIVHAQQAHSALMQHGDLQAACLPLLAVTVGVLECASTLGTTATGIETALDTAARAHNAVALPYFRAVQALSRSLLDERIPMQADASAEFTPVGRCCWHVILALHGALMAETAQLDTHSEAAFATSAFLYGGYNRMLATLLRALALAQQAQRCTADQRAPLLSALAPLRATLALWAAGAPDNFNHLLLWLDAERAWAEQDVGAAAQGYDAALDALDQRQRPWHQALITERAGRFHLAHAMPRAGRHLLACAHRQYQAWGAAAKVARLEQEHLFLQDGPAPLPVETERRAHVSGSSLHMLAVLRASQALSSETSLAHLHARVAEQLGAMTGASEVRMMLPHDSSDAWILAGAAGDAALPVEHAAAAGLLPLSAFRYVARTRTALVVDDATRDERFAADPYWRGMQQCSLLLLPILNRGALRAVLMLENHQRRGAFAADRLEAVELIAGQLAVSLDNAMLYASLERKVAERTRALELANQELAALSVTDALTGLANRRHFDHMLDSEWRRALRTTGRLGAAMIDIDHFKLYNDHYGHQQGDVCLQAVAATLAGSIRQGVDLVARYGGEEFVIILPGADLAETRAVAERARAAVAALAAPHLHTVHGVVTVSIGVASLAPGVSTSPAALFGAADAALYQAKQRGRNRVHDAP